MLALLGVAVVVAGGPPLPNAAQLEFMDLEFIQFMHFGVDTAWKVCTDHGAHRGPMQGISRR